MRKMRLERGDILLTAGTSKLSEAIRWAQVGLDYKHAAVVNHVAYVVEGGELLDVEIVEWDKRVRRGKLIDFHRKDVVWAERPLTVDPHTTDLICMDLLERVGDRYGFGEFIPQLIDNKVLFGLNVFRRLAPIIPGQQCSTGAISVFARHSGIDFGKRADCVTPHDVMKFTAQRRDLFARVFGENLGMRVELEIAHERAAARQF